MPLLDYFRLPRLGKAAAPPPPALPASLPLTRLDRMVARQKGTRHRTEMEMRLDALEEEYSEPLYASSAYSTPIAEERED